MEKALSKRRIVELYLNVAEWGDGIFGIEAAARHYYGKHASALSAQEASRLATVLPNPIRYKVNGDSRYVKYRSARIYRIMVARGIVIPEYEEVMTEPEEKPENAPAEALAGEAGTAGAAPPSGEAAQEKKPEESPQAVESPPAPQPPSVQGAEAGNQGAP
jgi:monofunctional biosynthetic peptidoglycan transglycosylase